MARLLLILIAIAVCVAFAAILHGVWTTIVQTGNRGMRAATGSIGGIYMGSTGIQKAAYIALIVMMFGVASGWLGGL